VPAPSERLLLFAGKGGVGKTTLAGATALSCAARTTNASTLLLSTDPAHSLSTALSMDLGDTPTRVAPGLDALEVDAPARFDALRADYVDEVRQFFRTHTAPNVDLPYDRPVMEGLIDLAPPGVDEVMGWTAALDALDGDYDTCVLDAAPTGHFVRLLEMPRLFEEWLQAFFRLLRKYRSVVRLPRLSDRLVRLSKQVKALRRMLEDGDGAVYGVTLPAQMAWAETDDLLAAAGRLGVSVPVLVLNRVPSASAADTLAAADRRVEGPALGAVTEADRGPQGVDALQRLGTALYD
jgi:arsenite-transporting ATPase